MYPVWRCGILVIGKKWTVYDTVFFKRNQVSAIVVVYFDDIGSGAYFPILFREAFEYNHPEVCRFRKGADVLLPRTYFPDTFPCYYRSSVIGLSLV